MVGEHRDFFNRLTRWLWGERLEPQSDTLVRWLFFRALGLVYLIAFASFGVQAPGLIGSDGILPLGDYLQWINQNFGALGSYSPKPWLTNRLTNTNPSVEFRLSTYNIDPWFMSFILRLQQGSPTVLALLGSNPFRDAPPRFLRAQLYDYRFTDIAPRDATGAWWQRELLGVYFPTITVDGNP
jgi:Lipase maturation factor